MSFHSVPTKEEHARLFKAFSETKANHDHSQGRQGNIRLIQVFEPGFTQFGFHRRILLIA